jgi:hypothetical protein
LAVAVNEPPIDEAPNTNAVLLLIETAFVPLLFKLTEPVKLFALPFVNKSIVLAPALTVVVPGTTIAPVCETAPPAVKDKLPLLVNVIAPNVIPALVLFNVKLRKFVKPVKLEVAAFTFLFVNEISRISAATAGVVLLKTTAAVPKLLFAWFNKISELAALTPNVVVPPVAVIAVLFTCVILPPAVNVKLPPTLTVPSCRAALSTKLTALEPEFVNATVPVKLFVILFKAILLVVFADKFNKFNVVLAFCVTTPLMLLNDNVPNVALTLPNPTVVAPVIEIAVDDVFVDVNVPELNCAAPPPALIAIVPVPELTVPAVCVTPKPVKEIALFVVLIPLLRVNKPLLDRVSVADEDNAPLTVNGPVLLTLIAPTLFVIAFSVNTAIFVNATSPLVVFNAPKLDIVFVAPTVFSDAPPTDVNANVEALIVLVALSPIIPVDVKLTVLLPPPEIFPLILNAPLFKVTVPVPDCDNFVKVTAPVFV